MPLLKVRRYTPRVRECMSNRIEIQDKSKSSKAVVEANVPSFIVAKQQRFLCRDFLEGISAVRVVGFFA